MTNELLVKIRQIENQKPTLSLLKSFPIALFIATISIFVCQTLIDKAMTLRTTPKHNFNVDLVRLERKEPDPKRPLKPVKSLDKAPLVKPLTSTLNVPKELTSAPIDFQILTPVLPFVEFNNLISGDGNYFPRTKIPPIYPIRARNMGIEGFCTVKYTITKDGKVENVISVPGECRNLFRASSIEAAKKFLYKPRIIDGEAVEVENVKNKFIYKLQRND